VGLSPVEGGARASTTVRDHAFTLASLLLVVFGVLVTLVVLLPFPFRAVADPYATPGGVRPPWYLLAPYALTQALPLPAWLPGIGIVLAGLALPFLPVWLSRVAPGISDKRLRIGGLALLGLWVLLSVFGTLMEGRK